MKHKFKIGDKVKHIYDNNRNSAIGMVIGMSYDDGDLICLVDWGKYGQQQNEAYYIVSAYSPGYQDFLDKIDDRMDRNMNYWKNIYRNTRLSTNLFKKTMMKCFNFLRKNKNETKI